jgi:hypothetical protein
MVLYDALASEMNVVRLNFDRNSLDLKHFN